MLHFVQNISGPSQTKLRFQIFDIPYSFAFADPQSLLKFCGQGLHYKTCHIYHKIQAEGRVSDTDTLLGIRRTLLIIHLNTTWQKCEGGARGKIKSGQSSIREYYLVPLRLGFFHFHMDIFYPLIISYLLFFGGPWCSSAATLVSVAMQVSVGQPLWS